MDNDKYSIALWGPTSSGKTWFIHSFAKRLLDFEKDGDFTYEIKDARTNALIPSTPPELEGTSGLEDQLWSFRRIPKKQTQSHKISSYQHFIRVRDDKGQSLFEIDDDDNFITRMNVLESDYILIMLDPVNLSDDVPNSASVPSEVTPPLKPTVAIIQTEGDDNTQISPERNLNVKETVFPTRAQYTNRLEKLLQILSQDGTSKNKKYHIAVCVTKIDRLKIYERDPWELILLYFGRAMYDMLRRYQNMSQFILETFSVSSFGFFGVHKVANYEAGTGVAGKLKNSGDWNPYNVEAPLFWLFQEVEKQKIQSQNNGVIANILFSGERKNSYIGYNFKRT